jgi:hypothetical protein
MIYIPYQSHGTATSESRRTVTTAGARMSIETSNETKEISIIVKFQSLERSSEPTDIKVTRSRVEVSKPPQQPGWPV